MSYASDEYAADYEALAMIEEEEEFYRQLGSGGLTREVLETMSNYSSSSNVSLRYCGLDEETPFPPSPPPRNVQEQQRIQELESQLVGSETMNAELSTAHDVVCLERDNLKRFLKLSWFVWSVITIVLVSIHLGKHVM